MIKLSSISANKTVGLPVKSHLVKIFLLKKQFTDPHKVSSVIRLRPTTSLQNFGKREFHLHENIWLCTQNAWQQNAWLEGARTFEIPNTHDTSTHKTYHNFAHKSSNRTIQESNERKSRKEIGSTSPESKKPREEAGSIHKDEEPEAQALYVLDSSAAAQLPNKRDND